ncbi:proline/glycine betaine ABC transporter permease [Pseudomonas sp. CC120222-01a]|uniref:ABC transporter permease n=1 Tax=Pseudomonas sp. CC120222-01a TaxID=1378075 RepID=UPI000D941D5D|nr:ABC transporter permease subunit [Pseudomonas sp. CC120222-01a]PVZ41211.1 glycine betaine/proline transport system permease protein [Pseudomonas sp. CC120222-01a]
MATPEVSPGALIAPFLSMLNNNFHDGFKAVAGFFDGLISGIASGLSFAPSWVTIAVLSLLALLVAGWRGGALCLFGLGLCLVMGMWEPAVQTLALILVAVAFSLVIGIIVGVLISRSRLLEALARPCLDVMQTMPPWVYLVPAVVLFGLGTVPALLATIVFGVPPMIRLTLLAIRQVPINRLELGAAIGAKPSEIFWKIELPSALPTLLVGVNQCVLLSLGMVVLAGLVGAGGLGSEVTRGLTRMEFGLGVRASLAIVVLALILDRICRGSVPARYLNT